MTEAEAYRRYIAFHEAGHVAIVYWRAESLHSRRIALHSNRYGGSVYIRQFDATEMDLMVLIGGPLAEFLSRGIVPCKALRFANEYPLKNSDSNRIRNLVRTLCRGKDDRRYQFQVQEKCRTIIQEPAMWTAISTIADRLMLAGEITGEKCDEIFEACDAPQMFDAELDSELTAL